MDGDVSFLKQIEGDFKEVHNARKVVGEWEFEIEGITLEKDKIVKIKALLNPDGSYSAIPNIMINVNAPEGRGPSPEKAVYECLSFLLLELKSKPNPKIADYPYY